MSRLLLLRHAKAGWAEPGTRDFDRDLEPGGHDDAAAMGRMMRTAGYLPDLVLCSTAKRASETWSAASPHIGDGARVVMTEALYSADAAGYLGIVRESGDVETVLVIGHNPMIEDVAFALTTDGDDGARQTLSTGFPTAGLAVVGFGGRLADIAPGRGTLEAFLSPADA